VHAAPWMPATVSKIRAVGRWLARPAIRGQGTMLVGKYPDGTLVALAPPGVALPTSSDVDARYSFEGWRIAFWLPCLEGQAWIELRRPDEHHVLTLQEAVMQVPPGEAKWIFERCRRLASSAAGYLSPDANGQLPWGAEEAQAGFDALLGGLHEVFPREPWETYRPAMPDEVTIPDAVSGELGSPRPQTSRSGKAAPVTLDN
jgi:hypothetical protein